MSIFACYLVEQNETIAGQSVGVLPPTANI